VRALEQFERRPVEFPSLTTKYGLRRRAVHAGKEPEEHEPAPLFLLGFP
jgi:hypothetical protein